MIKPLMKPKTNILTFVNLSLSRWLQYQQSFRHVPIKNGSFTGNDKCDSEMEEKALEQEDISRSRKNISSYINGKK